jgi:transcriptional antiterminator RfaH
MTALPLPIQHPDSPDSRDPPDSVGWYLVHTKPRLEEVALTHLERQAYECYLPKMWVEKVRRGKAHMASEPMFSRYLFVRLDTSVHGQSWSPIRSTQGVSRLVRFGMQPAKVDAQLVDLLRKREQSLPAERLFAPGEQVQVAQGPFAGIEAIYQTTDAEHRSLILIDILSKTVSLHIDTAALRKMG